MNPTPAEQVFDALCQARATIQHFPDTPARHDVHHGLRIIAAALGTPPLKVRPPTPDANPYDTLTAAVANLEELVKRAHLPERRDWIYQNALALLKDGLTALRVAVRPVRKPPPSPPPINLSTLLKRLEPNE